MGESSVTDGQSGIETDPAAVRMSEIRLSYTDPIAGRTESRDGGRRFCEVDGVVLVVQHPYRAIRSSLGWSAEAYTDHLDSGPLLEWAMAGGHFGFWHMSRTSLLDQIATDTGTPGWAAKRDAWLAVPRQRHVTGTYRLVRRANQRWALPNDPSRNSEHGPWTGPEAAHTALGSADITTPAATATSKRRERP